jgi:GAF domain-containing protein
MAVAWEPAVRSSTRLDAVTRSGLVDIGPTDPFDGLIELAVEVTGVPRGVVALVDGTHTRRMSWVGFPESSPTSAPVEASFCRFVVGSGRPFVVDDARVDPRTIGDPAITAFGAVSWAGYPIEDEDGVVLGTFCLMDAEAHTWSATDLLVLATLARAASTEIALRATRARLDAFLVDSGE